MQIRCECGQLRAEIKHFPSEMPGRLACYCDDCQTYLMHIKRTDLFVDGAGGTEIVPIYPCNLSFSSGTERLTCLRLSPQGIFRWSANCCNTPIANVQPGFPWIGVFARPYVVEDKHRLDNTFGPIRSGIMGKFARGQKPEGVADKLDFKAFRSTFPFLLKGFLLRKAKGSPFFHGDGKTPIAEPIVLKKELREKLRADLSKIERHSRVHSPSTIS
ncbi:MAG: hypothetical protein KF681_03280 [Bdellovibrionaceae bacterium]|nr:hypothetical protein [Pseudobdellovibrionaceae bacterium]